MEALFHTNLRIHCQGKAMRAMNSQIMQFPVRFRLSILNAPDGKW